MALTTHTKATTSKRTGRPASDRITDVETHIQAIEPERRILSLQAEKYPSQDRPHGYIYPVLTLPAEIVSEIFVRFIPVYPLRPPITGLLSPIILGQICRTWREIALSTPELWCRIGVSLPESNVALRLAQKLRTNAWLTRSGSCLLSIELQSDLVQELEPFIWTIAAHRGRWEHLKLRLPSMRHLLAIDGPLLSLRSLTLGLPSWSWAAHSVDGPAAFLTAPFLRRVALQEYFTVYNSILPWSQLTVLIVDAIMVYDCLIIFDRAVNLVYCRLTVESNSIKPSTAPIASLPRLETLVLRTMFNHRPVHGLIGSLILP
ncbi:hypothetical protein B0H13DRAFT_439052, partial [Mycena leptocephala]